MYTQKPRKIDVMPAAQHVRFCYLSIMGKHLVKNSNFQKLARFCVETLILMGKDQESIQSSTTPDPGYQWESDKLTVRHHRREPRGQPFPTR